MNFVNRKVTTAKSRYAVTEFERLKEEFLQEVVTTVEMEEIPSELTLNWDQTGIKSAVQHMDHGGARIKVSRCCWSK